MRPALLVAVVAGCSCGGNGDAVDSGPIDTGPDVFDACPGELNFETQVLDLITQSTVVGVTDGVTVTEAATANTASSAPNGRAILCLSAATDADVLHERANLVTNRMRVTSAAGDRHEAAREPLVSDVSTAANLDGLYTGLGLTRDAGATTVLIYVRSASFAAANGAQVAVAGAGASYVRDSGGDFEIGDTIGNDPVLLVPNVGGTQVSFTVSQTCDGPTTITLEPGAIASTFLVCDP